MPETASLKVLGTCLVTIGGRDVGLSRKGQALLSVLALSEAGPVPREAMLEMLWDRSGADQARQSLRQELWAIRRHLGFDAIRSEHTTLSLSSDLIEVDAVLFQSLAAAARRDDLTRAADLYRGELLAGMPSISPPFEEWLTVERRRLAGLAATVLHRLADAEAVAGHADAAIAAAQRLVNLDDLNEDAHRLLIRLLAQAGRRAEALRQYAVCAATLKRELGLAPDAQTEALVETVRRADGPAVAPTPPAPTPQVGGELALPHKPSLAVLPFDNLSGDPEQEYFADGMVTEITAAISRLPWLFVIARNSSFTYKNKGIAATQIARELGVRYILEGAVRRSRNRVRITGALIDTATGAQIWADRFDGALDDVFELQDRVAAEVACAIEPRLLRAEIERARREPPERLDAYDFYLRAVAQTYHHTAAAFIEAVELLGRALDIDPDYAPAAALLAWCRLIQLVQGWPGATADDLAAGIRHALAVVDSQRDDPEAMVRAAIVLFLLAGETGRASAVIDRALVLNPNSAAAWANRGWVDALRGRPDAAIEALDHALRLSPSDPTRYLNLAGIAIAHLAARRFEAAIEWADATLGDQPRFMTAMRTRIVAKAHLGRLAEAREELAQLLTIFPRLTIAQWRSMGAAVIPETQEIFVSGLRLAGLPER